MLPILYRIPFETATAQLLAYLLAVALVAYIAFNGWRSAEGPNGATPTPEQRRSRAISYGIFGGLVAAALLHYALPSVPLLGPGQNQGIPLHTYGILIGAGFLTAVSASALVAQREWPGALGLERRNQVFDLAFYVFAGGIVGAKALFTLVNWRQYVDHPTDIFSLSGGLVFQGALIGSGLVAAWYCRKHGIEFLRLLDFGLPAVSLGAAFGRLGCFAAGCCWGSPRSVGSLLAVRFPGVGEVTNLFGQLIQTPSIAFASMADPSRETRYVLQATGDVVNSATPGAVRLSEWVNAHHHSILVHPVQLYESLGQLLLFVGFMSLRRVRRFHGQIAGLWLMVYAFERATVELFRGDSERGTLHSLLSARGASEWFSAEAWYNLSTSQMGSLLIGASGLWLLYSRFKIFKSQRQPAPT